MARGRWRAPAGTPSPTVAHACRAAVANNMCPVQHRETCGDGFSAALARSVGRSPGFKAFFSSWNLRLTPVRARASSPREQARHKFVVPLWQSLRHCKDKARNSLKTNKQTNKKGLFYISEGKVVDRRGAKRGVKVRNCVTLCGKRMSL